MSVDEYFLRHYTLVIDRNEEMHLAANRLARQVLKSSNVTYAQYTAMDSDERVDRFANEIGATILDRIAKWYEESVSDPHHPGSMITSDVLVLHGLTLSTMLGEHYMPEDSEAAKYLR